MSDGNCNIEDVFGLVSRLPDDAMNEEGKSKVLRILMVSNVVPQDTTAGEQTHYRHFIGNPHFDLKIWERLTTPWGIPVTLLSRVHNRFACGRFATLANLCSVLCQPGIPAELAVLADSFRPDLIYTVAYKWHWRIAMRLASRLKIPLVTQFGDYWPDIYPLPAWGRNLLAKEFQELYRRSRIAFCVSKGMQQLLGFHPGSRLLPIIPRQWTQKEKEKLRGPGNVTQFRVLYSGCLDEIYGPMIQTLVASRPQGNGIELALTGPKPQWWSVDEVRKLEHSGCYRGMLPRFEFNRLLVNTDCFLAVMSFRREDRRRSETSFLSKISEYCQLGKPIVIWAPEYSSAVQWARESNAALVVSTPDPDAVWRTVADLANDSKQANSFGRRALQIGRTTFSPQSIQQIFEDGLREAVRLGSMT